MVRDLHESNPARDREEDAPEPPQIRRFRRLVSFTMVAMVIGILGIMGALVWKLTQTPPRNSEVVQAGQIELPNGFNLINASRSGSSLFLILENVQTGERLLQERSSSQQGLIKQYQLRELVK